jgi:putative nucleotidyltransferase with HDIG domain
VDHRRPNYRRRRRGESKDRAITLESLPVLPAVVSKLMSLDREQGDYFDQVVRLAAQDPPFCAKLMSAANVSASGPNGAITAIQPAVARLGPERVAAIVTAATVTRVFVPRTDGQFALWWHSIDVATTAEVMARALPQGGVDPCAVYVMGLLHDVGRFAMFADTPDKLDEVNARDWESPDELVRDEHDVYGFDHAKLGASACEQWRLPKLIVEAVRHHHDEDLDEPAWNRPLGYILRAIQAADIMTTVHFVDKAFLEAEPEAQRQALEARLGRRGAAMGMTALQNRPAIADRVARFGRALGLRKPSAA